MWHPGIIGVLLLVLVASVICKCPRTCETCDEDDNCLKCHANYWGEKCEERCDAECYECEKDSGWCITCNYMTWGDRCEKRCIDAFCSYCNREFGCTRCEDDRWGEDCSKMCPVEQCRYGNCDQHTGLCEDCEYGLWNETCDAPCGDGCRECNRTTGVCIKCHKDRVHESPDAMECPEPSACPAKCWIPIVIVSLLLGKFLLFLCYKCCCSDSKEDGDQEMVEGEGEGLKNEEKV